MGVFPLDPGPAKRAKYSYGSHLPDTVVTGSSKGDSGDSGGKAPAPGGTNTNRFQVGDTSLGLPTY